jgi:hypothetical protein
VALVPGDSPAGNAKQASSQTAPVSLADLAAGHQLLSAHNKQWTCICTCTACLEVPAKQLDQQRPLCCQQDLPAIIQQRPELQLVRMMNTTASRDDLNDTNSTDPNDRTNRNNETSAAWQELHNENTTTLSCCRVVSFHVQPPPQLYNSLKSQKSHS